MNKIFIGVSIVLLSLLCWVNVASGQTICDTYTNATHLNSTTLFQFLVTAVFTNVTSASSPIVQYFNGTAGFPVYTSGAPFATLFTGLVNFFGAATGCHDQPGNVLWTITNHPWTNLTIAHAGLGIKFKEFAYFNQVLYDVLVANGVTPTDAATVNGSVYGTAAAVVQRYSICDIYADALGLNDFQFVSFVVNATVVNATTTGGPLLKYFSGSTGVGNTNFLTNAAAFNTLFNHLVQFFGSGPGGNGASKWLGCGDLGYPAYAGLTLTAAHASLGISVADFQYFNAIIVDLASSHGIDSNSVSAIAGLLSGTQAQVVQALAPVAAPTAPGTSAPTAGAASVIASLALIIAALLAALLF